MIRFKAMLYNNSTETMIGAIFVIPIIISFFLIIFWDFAILYYIVGICYICLAIMILLSLKRRFKYKYFTISYSKISTKYIWINQNISCGRSKDKCPQFEFLRELSKLKELLPKDKVYLCCAQEHIAELIRKEFTVLDDFKAYEKDLKKLKKKLRNKKCKDCSKKCSLMDHEKIAFYALKFI